jgi:poly-beta-1,6-N-acetyl-D-glucosamine synthase
MLIYLLLIFSLYFIFLILLTVGWYEAIGQPVNGTESRFISIVVAVRNEEKTLPVLMASLATQKYDRNEFEVILVNDQSTDQTLTTILDLKNKYPELKIISITSSGIGKKRALTEGIQLAKGEIILTTDADCKLPPDWISGITASFGSTTSMVVGALKIDPDFSFFSELQALEFGSVMGSGISLLAWNAPVMCNGANLAFRKKAFETVQGYEGNFEIPSGDDEFLMRKIENSFPGTIRFASRKDCVVATQPANSVRQFYYQRLRWAGKWKANESIFAKSLAVFVLLVQISWLVMFGLLISKFKVSELVGLIIIKLVLEGFFLWVVCRYLQLRFNILAFCVLQVIYPVYVIVTGISSRFITYRWKDREVSISR